MCKIYKNPIPRAILERIAGSWGSLMETCLHKKQKLLEAYNEMLYNRGVSDLQNWLQEIEVLTSTNLSTYIILQSATPLNHLFWLMLKLEVLIFKFRNALISGNLPVTSGGVE